MFGSIQNLFGNKSANSQYSSKQNQFRPQLEDLEKREVLSCSVSVVNGDTLLIIGDNSANNLKIIQNDNTDKLKIKCDGITKNYKSSKIDEIIVKMKDGNDKVWYGLSSGSGLKYGKETLVKLGKGNDDATFEFRNGIGGTVWLQSSMELKVSGSKGKDDVVAHFNRKHGGHLKYVANLGNGNDSSISHLWGDISGGADVYLKINGGKGDDFISTWNTFDNFAYSYSSIDVTSDSTLKIKLKGGDGDDTINATYSGELDGQMNMCIYAGDGNDKVDAEVYLQSGSGGQFAGKAYGQEGNDNMQFKLKDYSGGNVNVLYAFMDGGPGYDKWNWMETTSNVSKYNFELSVPLIFLPSPSLEIQPIQP